MTLINPAASLRAARAEKAKRHLSEFVKQSWHLVDPGMPLRWGWHADAICDHLEAVTRGWIRKLLINIPPGHAKSLFSSVFWPAWEWTFAPSTQSIFSSYAQELAERDSIRCRDLILQPWYQESFVRQEFTVGPQEFYKEDGAPWDFNPAQNRVNSFKNTMAGSRQCLSVGSKATGFRGNKVVCDDPLNVKEAFSKVARDEAIYWWSKVMPTRVNDPAKGSFVIIMQRVHEEDLSGFVLAGGGYEHLCLPTEFDGDRRCVTYIRKPDPEDPAKQGPREPFFQDPRTEDDELLFPALFTREVVEELKDPVKGLGADGYAGQHGQLPTSAEGGIWKKAWWRFWRPDGVAPAANVKRPKGCLSVEEAPAKVAPAKFHQIIGSVDAAFKETEKSDFVVATIWGVYFAERYLLDLRRERMDFDKTCIMIAGCGKAAFKCSCLKCLTSLARKWPKCRRWLIEDKANGPAIVNRLKTKLPGVLDVNPEGGKEARAQASTPSIEAGQVFLPEGAPWVPAFVEECAAFPRGKNDDQVDSTSQALIYLDTNVDLARSLALAKAT